MKSWWAQWRIKSTASRLFTQSLIQAQIKEYIRAPRYCPLCGEFTIPNVARTISCKAWNSPAEYPRWVARCDTKGSDGTMLNPIFWKKVQGQKHPGRWGIVEHQIPSIKVLFKINAKSHKHPGIKLLSSESKTQLIIQRKHNSYRNILIAYIYIYINTDFPR